MCGGAFGNLWTFDGERFRAAALRRVPEGYVGLLSRAAVPPRPGTVLGHIAAGKAFAQIPDAASEDAYMSTDARTLVELGGGRTIVDVPLRKETSLLGAITIFHQEVRPFTEKQIALLQNFAAQAVIAMENARLLTETREALEQQTATAEVLGVINSSPGDLAPVFNAILEKALSLCEAAHGHLTVYQDGHFHCAAAQGDPRFVEWFRRRPPYGPGPGTTMEKIVQGASVVQVADVTDDEAYRLGDPVRRAVAEIGGSRTAVSVALRKEDTLFGAVTVYRQEVRPFTDKQIALLQNFAAQAVIAMENARLLTETREALEQQTATAEVLQVINSSPGDLVPVFDAMLDKATRLCEAASGIVWIREDEGFRAVALSGLPQAYAEFVTREPWKPGPQTTLARVATEHTAMHRLDIKETVAYRQGDPFAVAAVELGGMRSMIAMPLLKDGIMLGSLSLYRREVHPFSEKQIMLVGNFAAQAVIAMENARLLTETREALDQQTATAEVLQVINSSPGDLTPVFDAMLEKATRLCQAEMGAFWTFDGEYMHVAAMRGVSPAYAEFLEQGPHRPGSGQLRFLRGERLIHTADITKSERYRSGDSLTRAVADLGGIRTLLVMPLRKDDAVLGSIGIYRQEVRAFTEKQIALLQSFAAQAVIAMENARLLTGTREALDQQTATSEVLQVINSSPGDLAPVFDAMLEKAVRLCGGSSGILWTLDGQRASLVASTLPSSSPIIETLRRQGEAGEHPLLERVIRGDHLFQFDLVEHEAYRAGTVDAAGDIVASGVRSLIWVALVKDNTAVGVFVISRRELCAFSDREIALLQNFAAQAVIAMENARLITETREALEQQTATSEVLQVINSSPGNLTPVFDAMLDKAAQLCDAPSGIFWTFDGEYSRAAAMRGIPDGFAEYLSKPVPLDPQTGLGRVRQGEHVAVSLDLAAEEPYRAGNPQRRAFVDLGGARSAVRVPLIKGSKLLGIFTVYRQEVRPFTDKQIALLQNFAAQAVIAMENARLLTETREALEQQTATAEVLGVINSSPGDLVPVWDAMLEKAASMCEANLGFL